jgi:hypothetical protein
LKPICILFPLYLLHAVAALASTSPDAGGGDVGLT